ncbi:sodium bile acid cotransporter [Penicillium coprophilum]|uniref:sodium bile acid cotransporter n=1 Tax=Penicillium coprophilum TaxID=36646 RepID=UPI00238D3660|nr:sodium bile acid cotransporter [Penicillium coprophilum]KAJ5178474.1 sodium bile acid cotransporter [Penicillium coprophilum]
MEAAPDIAQPRWQRGLKRIASLILHQWLLIGIGIVCALAYCFPNVAKHGGTIRSEYSIMYGVIAIIFLISGLSIPRQKLISHVLNWRLHVIVQVISFIFIPALVLAIVHIILAADPGGKIDRAVLAGYIFTACIPTTIASNVVMTRSAGGDDAAALVEVLLANILGPFVTAAWTIALMPKMAEFYPWRYGGGDLGSMYKEIFQQLGLSVLLPLFVGQLVKWTWPDRTALVLQKTKLPKLATVCLLLLIWATFSSCFATGALQTLSAQSIVFVVLFNIILYTTLTTVCFFCSRPPQIFSSRRWSKPIFKRMSPEETIAVCFCGPAKSTALGIPLLYAMWQPVDLLLKAKTSVPVLLYTTEQICVAHFFVQLFRWWHARIVEKEELDDRTGDDVGMSIVEDPHRDHAGRGDEHTTV